MKLCHLLWALLVHEVPVALSHPLPPVERQIQMKCVKNNTKRINALGSTLLLSTKDFYQQEKLQ